MRADTSDAIRRPALQECAILTRMRNQLGVQVVSAFAANRDPTRIMLAHQWFDKLRETRSDTDHRDNWLRLTVRH